MKWIEQILEIEPYKMKVLWNDGIIRSIDFDEYLKSKSRNTNSSYSKLLNYSLFAKAKCDGTTIYWENLISYEDVDGTEKIGNLDISPELLYELVI